MYYSQLGAHLWGTLFLPFSVVISYLYSLLFMGEALRFPSPALPNLLIFLLFRSCLDKSYCDAMAVSSLLFLRDPGSVGFSILWLSQTLHPSSTVFPEQQVQELC